jgi:hypothetical protein
MATANPTAGGAGRFYPPGEAEFRRFMRSDPCAYCGKSRSVLGTLDHIVPHARGGVSDLMNLAAACEQCNRWKGSRSLLGFLLVREELERQRRAKARAKRRRRRRARRALARGEGS